MNKWLGVTVLALSVLTGAMGLKAFTTHSVLANNPVPMPRFTAVANNPVPMPRFTPVPNNPVPMPRVAPVANNPVPMPR